MRQRAALRRWRLCRLEQLPARRALRAWQQAHALQELLQDRAAFRSDLARRARARREQAACWP